MENKTIELKEPKVNFKESLDVILKELDKFNGYGQARLVKMAKAYIAPADKLIKRP